MITIRRFVNTSGLPNRQIFVSEIVHNISDFLSSRNSNIEQTETKIYPAAHTGTTMFSLGMIICVPSDSSIKSLRDEFITFCDDMNLDASLESKR